MTIVTVVSVKGGVGKTMVASNLAAVLASKFKRKVMVADCNLTAPHLGLYTGIERPEVTLNHVLTGKAGIEDAVYVHQSGAEVVPASLNIKELSGIDFSKIYNIIREENEEFLDRYEIIFLDAAPGLGREAMAAVRAAEFVLYVTNPHIPHVLDLVRSSGIIKTAPLGVILNMVYRKGHELKARDIENLVKMPVLGAVPHDIAVHKSIAKGIPVSLYRPFSRAGKALFRIAGEINDLL